MPKIVLPQLVEVNSAGSAALSAQCSAFFGTLIWLSPQLIRVVAV